MDKICWGQIVIVSLILTSISAVNPSDEVPNISVKMSTSVVETTNFRDPKSNAYSIESNRQQRSLPTSQQDHFISDPQKLKFKSQDALHKDFGSHQEVRLESQQQHQHQHQLHELLKYQPNTNGRIWEQQPGYRRSVSSSWDFSPNTQHLQATQKQLEPTAVPSTVEIQSRDWSNAFNDKRLEMDYKCSGRSFGRMLRSTKNLLTSGFSSLEQYATPGNIMLGSSFFAAAIPLAVFMLPDYSRKRRTGLDDDSASRFSFQGRVDSVMGWIERSVEHLPSFPRLHPQECVKRSICEAHNDPNKYGAIGFILRLFFPATNLNSTDKMDNMEYKVINKYRHAAGYGLNKRLDNNGTSTPAPCKEKYEDCLVSLLDVAQNLMDLFLK